MSHRHALVIAVSFALFWRPLGYFAIEVPFVIPRHPMPFDVPAEVELALLLPIAVAAMWIGSTTSLRTGVLVALGMAASNALFVTAMAEFRMRYFEHSENDPVLSAFSFLGYFVLSGVLMLVGRGVGRLWRTTWKAVRHRDGAS